ncbi:MAG: hypothetical protein JXR63_03740 [Spirochaetales bacterium]|nr:hypothetical protein [Spirochaetales bacterium]
MRKILSICLFTLIAVSVFADDFNISEAISSGNALDYNEDARFSGYNRIESVHFSIIYEPVFEEAAFEVYTWCDDIYEDLAEFFDVQPSRLKLIIRGRIDGSNGSYSPMPEHINLYVTSPSDFFLGARTENWLKALLIHEMTHYFHIGYEDGFFYSLSKAFGSIVKAAPSAFQPGWMMEGITTNTETIFSNGGRGRNPFFEIIYKSLILEQNMFDLKQAAYSSNFQPYGRIYVAGYIIVDHILRNYGDDAFLKIHKETIRNPLAPYKAIEKVLGKPMASVYDDMKEELLLKYQDSLNLPKSEVVVPLRESSWARPFLAEDRWIIYRSDPDRGSAVVSFDPISKKEDIIKKVSLTDRYSIDVSPDATQAILSVGATDVAHPAGSSMVADLYSLDLEKGQLKRITKNKHLWHPVYFGEDKVVAVQRRSSYSDLVLVDLVYGTIEVLFSREQCSVFNPSISPDLSMIVFAVNSRGVQNLWVYDTTTDEVRELTGPSNSCEYYSRFISDKKLIFSSDREGDLRLYQYDFENSKFAQIHRDRVAAIDGLVVGDYLYYNSYSTQGYTIKKVELDETAYVEVDFSKKREYPELFSFKKPEKIKKYHDVPDFIAWAPVPLNLNLVYSSQNWFGIGFSIFSRSSVTDNSLQFIATNPYNNFQPNLFLDTSFDIWRFPTTFSFKNYYTTFQDSDNPDLLRYSQVVNTALNMDFPLYYTSIGSDHFRIKYSAGLNYQYSMSKNDPFMMFDVPNFDIQSFDQSHNLEVSNSLSFTYSQSSSMRNLFPGNSVGFNFRNIISTPIDGKSLRTITLFGLEANIKTFDKQSIYLQCSIGYSNFANVAYSFASNGFALQSQAEKGALLLSFGYSFNIAEFDLPLFWSLNWQAIGARIFLSTKMKFDIEAALFTYDPYLYFGLEVVNLLGFAQAVFPLKAGLVLRVDTSGANQFDPSTDIVPIFSLDFSQYLGITRRDKTLENITNQGVDIHQYVK